MSGRGITRIGEGGGLFGPFWGLLLYKGFRVMISNRRSLLRRKNNRWPQELSDIFYGVCDKSTQRILWSDMVFLVFSLCFLVFHIFYLDSILITSIQSL